MSDEGSPPHCSRNLKDEDAQTAAPCGRSSMDDRDCRSADSSLRRPMPRPSSRPQISTTNGPYDTKRVFVGRLLKGVTSDVLEQHFSAYGHIERILLPEDPSTGRSKGYAFITFTDPFSVRKVLNCPQVIDGIEVDCKPAYPKDHRSGVAPMGTLFKTRKIVIGEIPSSTTTNSLHAYFSRYGSIVECRISKAAARAYCEFTSETSVDRVMRDYGSHILQGKWVQVKRHGSHMTDHSTAYYSHRSPVDDAYYHGGSLPRGRLPRPSETSSIMSPSSRYYRHHDRFSPDLAAGRRYGGGVPMGPPSGPPGSSGYLDIMGYTRTHPRYRYDSPSPPPSGPNSRYVPRERPYGKNSPKIQHSVSDEIMPSSYYDSYGPPPMIRTGRMKRRASWTPEVKPCATNRPRRGSDASYFDANSLPGRSVASEVGEVSDGEVYPGNNSRRIRRYNNASPIRRPDYYHRQRRLSPAPYNNARKQPYYHQDRRYTMESEGPQAPLNAAPDFGYAARRRETRKFST